MLPFCKLSFINDWSFLLNNYNKKVNFNKWIIKRKYSFDEKNNVFYQWVGDDEILKFNIDSPNSNWIPRIKNYQSDYTHIKKCENIFSLI